MSGNQPQDDTVPPGTEFPAIGQYDWIPGPGDAGYVPSEDLEDEPTSEGDEVIDDESEAFDDGLDDSIDE